MIARCGAERHTMRSASNRSIGCDGDWSVKRAMLVLAPGELEEVNGTRAGRDGEQAAFGGIGQPGGPRSAQVEWTGEREAAERAERRILRKLDHGIAVASAAR